MRIIAGKYRGRNLKGPPSMQVRPTSDRLRETLFNVLAPRIVGAKFLDLCAGSGAVGIEALSRGAAHAIFVDQSRKMCGLVEANLDLVGVPEDETRVVQAVAADYLRRQIAHPRKENEAWDLVFFDPPYDSHYVSVLQLFGSSSSVLLADDGMIIVEHYYKNALPDELEGIHRSRILKQGDSSLSFYLRK
jgi:16S rRNA (guanine(966)-N(2))-methyltransferase RsmD